MTEIIIKLNKANATQDAEGNVTDWLPALRAAAAEVQAINDAYSGTDTFPDPIPCNPDAEQVESILGENTPPSEAGHVRAHVLNYNSLEYDLFPVQPTTFTYTWGNPTGVGRFI